MTPNTSLSRLAVARRALEVARSLDEVKEVRDQAEAVRMYCKAAKQGKNVANVAAEIKLRAERRAGEMLAAMDKHSGRPKKNGCSVQPLSLADLDIDKSQSHRWQRIAAVPLDAFEAYIADMLAGGKEITTAGILGSGGIKGKLRAAAQEWELPEKFWQQAGTLGDLANIVRRVTERLPDEGYIGEELEVIQDLQLDAMGGRLRALADQLDRRTGVVAEARSRRSDEWYTPREYVEAARTETIVDAVEPNHDEDRHEGVDDTLGDEIASTVMRVRLALKDVADEHLAAVLAAVRAELDRIEERSAQEAAA